MSSCFETSFEELKRLFERRSETDYLMPVWLPLLPFILMASTSLLLLPAILLHPQLLTLLSIVMFLGFIISVYVLYKLIDRRNKHFKRQFFFNHALLNLLKKLNERCCGRVSERIRRLERLLREAEFNESERSAALWVILAFLTGILTFYVYHFLTKDFKKHEEREELLVEEVKHCLSELGLTPMVYVREKSMPRRNTILYFTLSIVTLGVFNLYWLYALTVDPNNHFKEHSRWESELLAILEPHASSL